MKIKSLIRCFLCLVLVISIYTGMTSCSNINDENNLGSSTDLESDGNNSNNLSEADYSIVEIDNEYYLVFDDISIFDNSENCELATVEFASIKEFKDTVTQGKLSDFQKRIIASAFYKNDKGILSCDFNNLYQPVLPENGNILNVGWSGGNIYSFEISLPQNVFGFVRHLPQEKYNHIYKAEYEEYFNKQTITVEKTENAKGDETKTVTYYSTSAGKLMQIRYSLSSGDKKIVVDKTFRIEMQDESIGVSATVPTSITLYCTENGVSYVINLFGMKDDLDDLYLLQFGMEKYIDSSAIK